MTSDFKYTQEHEWIKQDGDIVLVGITEYAKNALGELVYVELPEVGQEVKAGEDFAVVESVKVASEVYSPVTGEIVEINEDLSDDPENLKNSLEEGWIAKIKISDPAELQDLMDSDSYDSFIEGLED